MVTEEAWRDAVPADATVTGRRQEVRSHRSIPDGTQVVTKDVTVRVRVGSRRVKVGVEDLGNGRFRERYEDKPVYENKTERRRVTETRYRREPVYDEKVTYQVPRWGAARTVKASGTPDQDLRWPDAALAADEREAGRTERLLVMVRPDDDPAPRVYEAASRDDWRRFKVGQRCRGGCGRHGRALGLNPK